MASRSFTVQINKVSPNEKRSILAGRRVVVEKNDGKRVTLDDKEIPRDANGNPMVDGRIVDGNEYFREVTGAISAQVSLKTKVDDDEFTEEHTVDIWMSDCGLTTDSSVGAIEAEIIKAFKAKSPKFKGAVKV